MASPSRSAPLLRRAQLRAGHGVAWREPFVDNTALCRRRANMPRYIGRIDIIAISLAQWPVAANSLLSE